MDYRIYLMDQEFHIRAAEHFTAPSDAEAIETASALHQACSDTFAWCEVWRGSLLLTKLHADGAEYGDGFDAPRVRSLIPVRQENVIQLEERLQRSFACVRESRNLMRIYNEMTTHPPHMPRSQIPNEA